MDDSLQDLRAADLVTFLAVHRARSVSAAARVLGVTPSQVSKAVARFERALDVALLVRGPRGIALSEEAQALVPRINDVVSRMQGLRGDASTKGSELTLAAPSFLHGPFAPAIAAGLPEHRLRWLSMSPVMVRAYATERIFQAAVTVGRERFSERWVETELGQLRAGLFASPALAARLGGRKISEAALHGAPFIAPISLVNGQPVPADDGCPWPRDRRRVVQEVETIAIGLELAAQSMQLVYGPVLSAQAYLRGKRLVELTVEEWRGRSSETLYLYCDGDQMLARVQRTLIERCAGAITA